MPRTINYEQINAKLLKSSKVRAKVESKVKDKFETEKRIMIDGFLKDDISQEIMNPSRGNISGTLDGKSNKSLFGFIGFEAGSEPILQVAGELEQNTRISEGKVTGKKMEFKISHPSLRELYDKTPMPWESGRSWLYGISHGISGFGYFLAGFFQNLSKSRSGQGIQIKDQIHYESFKPRKYIEKYIGQFREAFGKGTN
jgi:hypothetical protein